MKTCPKCNTQCNDDVAFCPSCGGKLVSEQPKATQPKTTPAFCPSCGTKLEPGTVFCPKCGGKTDGTGSAGAPAIIKDTLTPLATFFTKGPTAAITKAAKSKGLGFIILAAFSMISFMFTVPTRFETLDLNALNMGRWGLNLLFSWLIWMFIYGGLSAAIFVVSKAIHKKDVHFFQALNMVAVAGLPMICLGLLNMLWGLLWPPLALMFGIAGAALSFMLLLIGTQKLSGLDKAPIISVLVCLMIVVTIPLLIVGIVVTVRGGLGISLWGTGTPVANWQRYFGL